MKHYIPQSGDIIARQHVKPAPAVRLPAVALAEVERPVDRAAIRPDTKPDGTLSAQPVATTAAESIAQAHLAGVALGVAMAMSMSSGTYDDLLARTASIAAALRKALEHS